LDATGVARNPITIATPQPVERLPGRLADDVPQRDLDTPAPAGLAKRLGMLLEQKRIRPKQSWPDPRFERRRFRVPGRAPAHNPVIGGQLDHHRVAPGPHAAWRPRWSQRLC